MSNTQLSWIRVCEQALDRVDVVNTVLARSDTGRAYLEVGVDEGKALRRVVAPTRVGVDPHFSTRILQARSILGPIRARLGFTRGLFLFRVPSDEFFRTHDRFLRRLPIGCVLVDGLHEAEQAYRDIVNSLAHLSGRGVVVVHDCLPASEVAALPSKRAAAQHPEFRGEWNGDVWKAIVRLRSERTDLRVCVLDCDQGVGLIARGRPEAALNPQVRWDDLEFADYQANRDQLMNVQPPEHLYDFIAA